MQNVIKPLAAGAGIITRARALLSAGALFLPWLTVLITIV